MKIPQRKNRVFLSRFFSQLPPPGSEFIAKQSSRSGKYSEKGRGLFLRKAHSGILGAKTAQSALGSGKKEY
jgi:hypothetical protein